MSRYLLLGLAAAGALCAAAPAGVLGQSRPAAPSLDRIERTLYEGDYAGARTALERWESDSAAAPGPRRTRAAMLRARLEHDATVAMHAYLSVALSDPFAEHAGPALLRVGQAALLSGDTAAARTYLRRLVEDYPTAAARAEALLWLSRTHAARRDALSACETAREGLAAGAAADVAALLRRQEASLCDAAPLGQASGAAAGTAATGSHAVQLGAFRGEAGARDLVRRLREAGYDARIVRVPANELMRVRVGRFGDAGAAAAQRNRLRAAGFDAVVVTDAAAERPAP